MPLVAQLAEQSTNNLWVGGANPSQGRSKAHNTPDAPRRAPHRGYFQSLMAKQHTPKKTFKKAAVAETFPVTLAGTAYASLLPKGEDGVRILEGMSVYLSTGSLKKVNELTGIVSSEMSTWMSQPWWDDMMAVLRQKQQDALDGRISGLIDLSLDTVEKRLVDGDPQWVKDGIKTEVLDKNGVLERTLWSPGLVSVPVKAGVAAKIMHTLYEKRALIRGDSTSNVRKEEGGLAKLAKLLESISKEKKTERVIPGERLE